MIEAGKKQPFPGDLGGSWQCNNMNGSICSENLPYTCLFGTELDSSQPSSMWVLPFPPHPTHLAIFLP